MNLGRAIRFAPATQDLLRGILLAGALVGAGLALVMLPLPVAAGVVLGVIVFLGVLAQPLFGLLLLILAIPFGSPFNVQIGAGVIGAGQGFNFGPTELLFALTLAAWLGSGVIGRRLPYQPSRSTGIPRIILPLGVLLFTLGLTLISTYSIPDSIKELFKWLEVLVLTLFVARTVRKEQVPWLLALMFAAAAIESLIGLYQTYSRLGPEPFLVPLGSQLVLRSYGTFEQPNPFAAYLNFSLTIITSLIIGYVIELRQHRRFMPMNTPAKSRSFSVAFYRLLFLVALLCLPLILAAFFFSLSRGAWMGFALAVVAITALRSRRAFVLFGVAMAVSLGVLVLGSLDALPPAIADRIADIPAFFGLNLIDPRAVVLTNENFGIVDRMAHWFAAWNMFVDHPWLGVGIGNYGTVYASYGLREWPFSLGHAHNFYLNMLAEAGIIGLSSYLLFIISMLVYAWFTVRRAHGVSRALAMGVLGAFVAMAAHNFFDNLYVHGMNMQLAILLGMLSSLRDDTSAHA